MTKITTIIFFLALTKTVSSLGSEVTPICKQYNFISSDVAVFMARGDERNWSSISVSDQLYIYEKEGELTITVSSGSEEVIVRLLKIPFEKRDQFKELAGNFQKLLTQYPFCDSAISKDNFFISLYEKTLLNLPIIESIKTINFDLNNFSATVSMKEPSVLGGTHYFRYIEQNNVFVYIIYPNQADPQSNDFKLNFTTVLNLIEEGNEFESILKRLDQKGFKFKR